MSDEITVEVVLALADTQSIKTVTVHRDAVLADVIIASGILENYPQDAQCDLSFGIWGQVVAQDHRLKDGDRVEVYRPLLIDPRDVRRKLAEVGRTMGRTRVD